MSKISSNIPVTSPPVSGMPTALPISGPEPVGGANRVQEAGMPSHQFESYSSGGSLSSTSSPEVLRDLGGQRTSLVGDGQMQSGIRQRSSTAGTTSPALNGVRDGMSLVQYGMEGENVSQLQQLLNKMGASLEVDGKFGPATLQAVKNFQQTHGLKMDGLVGPQTLRTLEGGSPTPVQPSLPPTSPPGPSTVPGSVTTPTPTTPTGTTPPPAQPTTPTGTTGVTGVNPTPTSPTSPVGQRIVSEAVAEDGKVSNTAYDGAEYQGWQHLQDTISQATRGPLGADGKHHPPGINYSDSNIRTHPRPIWTDSKGKVHHMDWCGVWATRMFQKAGVNCYWEPGTGVKGDVNKVFSPKPEDIKPGDMIVGPGPLWHHAIVTDIRRDATGKPIAFETMNGNHPGIGSGSMPAGNVQAYYRPKEA